MNNRQERLYFFLVVWFTMISSLQGWGQNPHVSIGSRDFSAIPYPGDLKGSYVENGVVFMNKDKAVPVSGTAENVSSPLYFSPNIYTGDGVSKTEALYGQPSNLYYLQSGFFCKREWEFEKTTHIPFRFRLGSLADCNKMEGKN